MSHVVDVESLSTFSTYILYLYFCEIGVDKVVDAGGIELSPVLRDDLLQEVSDGRELVHGLLHAVDGGEVLSKRWEDPGQARLWNQSQMTSAKISHIHLPILPSESINSRNIPSSSTSTLQGISKRLFPGCVKSGEKVAFCLPSAGRNTQCFHHIFSQPPCSCGRH